VVVLFLCKAGDSVRELYGEHPALEPECPLEPPYTLDLDDLPLGNLRFELPFLIRGHHRRAGSARLAMFRCECHCVLLS
jgi:hypothetical protein